MHQEAVACLRLMPVSERGRDDVSPGGMDAQRHAATHASETRSDGEETEKSA